MPLTGYTHATSPAAIILGPAILYVGGVPHSASRGTRVEFLDEITNPQIDGLVAVMAGTDYRASVGVRITGQFLELGAAQIARYQSNTVGVVAGGVTTFTPRVPGGYLPSPAGYVEDVEVRVVAGNGDIHAIAVPVAHVVTRSMTGMDGVALTLEARSTDPAVVPYVHTITAAGVTAPTILLSDHFNKATSTTDYGEPQIGGPYVKLGAGALGINGSGRLYQSSGGGDYTYIVADTGVADGTLACRMWMASNGFGLAVRASDINNLVKVLWSGGTLTLYTKIAGAYTSLDAAPVTWVDGDTLSVILLGTAITVQQAGVTVLSGVSAHNQMAAMHGIAAGSSGSADWDDLQFEG